MVKPPFLTVYHAEMSPTYCICHVMSIIRYINHALHKTLVDLMWRCGRSWLETRAFKPVHCARCVIPHESSIVCWNGISPFTTKLPEGAKPTPSLLLYTRSPPQMKRLHTATLSGLRHGTLYTATEDESYFPLHTTRLPSNTNTHPTRSIAFAVVGLNKRPP